MEEIKKAVLSLNVIGPMGDDKQEFQVGTNDEKTVCVQIGTIILKDDGSGALYLNNKEVYSSEVINQIAQDVLSAAEAYTNEAISTITSFDIIIVDELPLVGEKGYIYLIPKDSEGSQESSNEPNGYNEWIYVNNKWEEIGDTNLDLKDYYTSVEIDELFFKKSGGTISGNVSITGDLSVKRIKVGNAIITLSVDSSTEETTITISGGTIYLTGDVNVSGTIHQLDGDIIQYSSSNEVK